MREAREPSLGIDLGSVAAKAVLLDANGAIRATLYHRRDGGETAALLAFLDEVEPLCGGSEVRLGLTGPPPGTALAAWDVNGILAVGAGVGQLHPEARTVIEVGGHTSKSISLSPGGSVRDFTTNEACAAGTGAFLEQQARRLLLGVEELSRLAGGARRGATVAGRCSVFASSDMIHLQQKGTPLEEIAYGLCLAIARNCLTTLLKGRGAPPPVLLAGGCARNAGLLRAFREVLGEACAIRASAQPGLEGAIGAAALARDSAAGPIGLPEARRLLLVLLRSQRAAAAPLAPLRPPDGPLPGEEPAASRAAAVEGYLGLDVGSVSTDLVVLDRGGELISSVYLPTRGRPAEALLQGLALLRERFALTVLGCGATGSGRHLAARLVRAEVVKNEITCQLLGAQRYVAGVDTVLEIGGQDAKFLSVRGGAISDFAMNKVCAAGTGSFLEEQARSLGIDVCGDFAARAFASAAPCDLGSRCTVFMETEVVNAAAGGAPIDDICAGLAYSIARNYLDKVVGHRRIGNRIVFQRGVASNRAVVAAFEAILGRPVNVHPFNRISGAIGAALAARAKHAGGERRSTFAGLAPLEQTSTRSFECRRCANRCEVNVVETGRPGERAFFGDTCERYASGAPANAGGLPNLAEEYVACCEALFAGAEDGRPSIGIPRASTLMSGLPFWAVFWRELGFAPRLSRPSSQETVALGLQHLSVGVCLPVKLMSGHVHALLREGLETVFAPAVAVLPGVDAARSFTCPYTMAAPFLVGSSAEEARLLAPVLSFESEDAFADGFAPHLERLGTSAARVREAYRAGRQSQLELDEGFRRRAGALLRSLADRPALAVLGRPYLVLDAYLNMGLFERLRRLGVLAVPLTMLPRADEERSSLPWRYAADIHAAAAEVAEDGRLQPVVLTSFGCGPDAFTVRRVERTLGERARLVLELDEHRGEAGLVTRLEAFLDQLEGVKGSAPAGVEKVRRAVVPSGPAEVVLPYFADHAFAFSGLFRSKGYRTRVLPLPGRATRLLGEKHSLGKECHAYAMIAGDLVEVARQGGRDTVFFFPGTAIPCLLHEYGWGMQALLDELGLAGVTVSSPTGAQLLETFGPESMERLYMGLLAIELLAKAVCKVRPYELQSGRTEEAHRGNLARIDDAVAGGDVLGALAASLEELAAIPMREERDRPVVGLAGDIYTKVNPAGNDDLVRWLEQQGLEVWPSPFQIDIVDFGISRRFYESLSALDLSGLLVHGAVALRRAVDLWRVRAVVGARLPLREEPGYLELRRLAAPYMPNEAQELLFLNVAKIVDFARGGADGVVNAICFGCMVGNASAAVIERIRRDFGELPMVTAVYAGADDPARRMTLDAFVSQVKAHHRRRREAEAAPRGWLGLAG